MVAHSVARSLVAGEAVPAALLAERKVMTGGFAALVLWYLGYPDCALEAMHEALSIAAKLTDPWTVTMINVFAAWMRAYRREPHLVQQPAENALTLARE